MTAQIAPRPRAKQAWTVGQIVAVGFIKGLRVIEKIATPGDHKPDEYRLVQDSTGREYVFQPHYGLSRI